MRGWPDLGLAGWWSAVVGHLSEQQHHSGELGIGEALDRPMRLKLAAHERRDESSDFGICRAQSRHVINRHVVKRKCERLTAGFAVSEGGEQRRALWDQECGKRRAVRAAIGDQYLADEWAVPQRCLHHFG